MYVTSPFATGQYVPVRLSTEPAYGSQATALTTRSLASKAPLFCEGDDARCVYEVVSGVLRSTKLLADGRRQVVAFNYPGDIIGLSADTVYHHDCDAVCDAELRVIPLSSLGSDTTLLGRMMRCAAAEVAGMQDHFIMLGRKCAHEKVASFLVALMNRSGTHDLNCEAAKVGDPKGPVCFDLPMSRADIADFLGLTIETVSRTFTRLRKAGIIALPQPQRVCVTCPDRLLDMAEQDD